MAKGYRPVVRDQVFLFPPDMREWLGEDHPVWLVIRAVALLDTSVFHARRRTGGPGTAGYDPDMVVTVLVWAYVNRVFSSRRIEQLCRTDVAFRVICGGNLPDHSTLARFRAGFPGAVESLFTEMLKLCARLGMGKVGVIALDGTKVAASASKSANRSGDRLAELAREAVAAHAAADAEEDALFGDRAGDEVPEQAWSPRSRDERILAALADLAREREQAERDEQAKAAEFRRRRDAGERTGCSPAAAAVELAEEQLARVRAARAAQLAARGQDPAGAGEYCRVREAGARLEAARERAAQAQARAEDKARDGKAPRRNITDPDSRLMPVRGRGFIQGYNAQNVTSQDGLIIAEQLTQDPNDVAWFEPMMNQAAQAAALLTANQPPAMPGTADTADSTDTAGSTVKLALSDAGYLSGHNLTCPGPDRLIATGKHRDLEHAARHTSDTGSDTASSDQAADAIAAMRARLATEEGITAYRQRGHIAETPHGHIKHNLGFRQFTMRGKTRTAAEWTFICAIHNLTKALTSGHLTAATLTALTAS